MVEILLATYQGALHLSEQLESLLAQSTSDWRLLVRDDGSTDATPDLLGRYARRYPERVAVLEPGATPLGASLNFGRLLEQASGAHVMFCDQDDVWLPHKVEVTLAKMGELERRFGEATPLMVHTDLAVVGPSLEPIAASLWRHQRSDPARGASLSRLLVQNASTGCTVMINRALRDLALPVPAEAVMHDWWLGLVAAAFGRLDFLPEPTALYRQHSSNDTGARVWSVRRALRDTTRGDVRRALRRTQAQAGAFLERFGDRLPPSQRAMLAAYASLEQQGYLSKRYRILRWRFFHSGLVRNVGRLLLP